MYPSGELESRELNLRMARTGDETTHVLQPLRLSAFLDTPQAQRVLRGGGRQRR